MLIDLHTHSTASDGAYSPAEVVQLALTHQLELLALSDHDTVAGIAPARVAAANTSLKIITAIELSAEENGAKRDMLGYLIDPNCAALLDLLQNLQEARLHRVKAMLERLMLLGVSVDYERVLELARGGTVGRPHIARAMLERYYVSNLQEAFDRFLGEGKPAYIPHNLLSPVHAIEIIHTAGGVAVLAHPGRVSNAVSVIESLVPHGLDGIEAFYPDHTPTMIKAYRALAERHNLIVTGGSDFHRREPNGSARIGSVKFPKGVDPVAALYLRAERYKIGPTLT